MADIWIALYYFTKKPSPREYETVCYYKKWSSSGQIAQSSALICDAEDWNIVTRDNSCLDVRRLWVDSKFLNFPHFNSVALARQQVREIWKGVVSYGFWGHISMVNLMILGGLIKWSHMVPMDPQRFWFLRKKTRENSNFWFFGHKNAHFSGPVRPKWPRFQHKNSGSMRQVLSYRPKTFWDTLE